MAGVRTALLSLICVAAVGLGTVAVAGTVKSPAAKAAAAARAAARSAARQAALTSATAGFPACAGPAHADVRVTAVFPDGTLRLANGEAVRLTGLRLTDPAALRPLNGQSVRLFAPQPARDRYGRLRAQIVTADGIWWQRRVLEEGAAVVEIASDRHDCVFALYAAEGAARAAGRGVWAARPSRTPDTVRGDYSFQIVEGRVVSATRKNGRVYLNFGADWKTDFTVTVSPADMKGFRLLRANPLRLEGHIVRVRGIVEAYRGPEIEIYNPFQIVLADPAPMPALPAKRLKGGFHDGNWLEMPRKKKVHHAVRKKHSRARKAHPRA